MKVKIIEKESYFDLEDEINKFIKNRTDIIDIKYSGNCNGESYLEQYSAMIMIKD